MVAIKLKITMPIKRNNGMPDLMFEDCVKILESLTNEIT